MATSSLTPQEYKKAILNRLHTPQCTHLYRYLTENKIMDEYLSECIRQKNYADENSANMTLTVFFAISLNSFRGLRSLFDAKKSVQGYEFWDRHENNMLVFQMYKY